MTEKEKQIRENRILAWFLEKNFPIEINEAVIKYQYSDEVINKSIEKIEQEGQKLIDNGEAEKGLAFQRIARKIKEKQKRIII